MALNTGGSVFGSQGTINLPNIQLPTSRTIGESAADAAVAAQAIRDAYIGGATLKTDIQRKKDEAAQQASAAAQAAEAAKQAAIQTEFKAATNIAAINRALATDATATEGQRQALGVLRNTELETANLAKLQAQKAEAEATRSKALAVSAATPERVEQAVGVQGILADTGELGAKTNLLDAEASLKAKPLALAQAETQRANEAEQRKRIAEAPNGVLQIFGANPEGDRTVTTQTIGPKGEVQSETKVLPRKGVLNPITGQPTTPAEQGVDANFAKNYVAWKGGTAAKQAMVVKELDRVADTLGGLKTASGAGLALGQAVLSKVFGADIAKAIVEGGIRSEKAKDVVRVIRGSAMSTMRETLGSQFTQREGDNVVSILYDPLSDEETNAKRLRQFTAGLRAAFIAKQAMADYYEEHGTLVGYAGPDPEADFLAATYGEEPAARSTSGAKSAKSTKVSAAEKADAEIARRKAAKAKPLADVPAPTAAADQKILADL